MAQLLGSHLVLVQKVPELGLVVDIAFLLNVEVDGIFCRKFLGDGCLAIVKVFQKVGRDSKVVASTELGDLACVTERGTHH